MTACATGIFRRNITYINHTIIPINHSPNHFIASFFFLTRPLPERLKKIFFFFLKKKKTTKKKKKKPPFSFFFFIIPSFFLQWSTAPIPPLSCSAGLSSALSPVFHTSLKTRRILQSLRTRGEKSLISGYTDVTPFLSTSAMRSITPAGGCSPAEN